MPCWDGILPKRGSRRLDQLRHAIEVGSERPKSVSIQVRRERQIVRTNKKRFFHGMSSGRKRIHWAYLVVVMAGQPMG